MLLKTILFAFLATAVHSGPVDHIKEEVIHMCNENNATDKVEKVKILMDEYIECYPEMVHVEQLHAKFDEAQGTVDDVARKNCAKAAQTKACIARMYNAAALCNPKDDVLFGLDFANHAINYMCYMEDGKTRLAKFVNDDGFGCLTNKGINITECYSSVAPKGLKANLENWSRCIIDKLKTCSNPAAIRVQGLFENFRYEHPSGGNNQLL